MKKLLLILHLAGAYLVTFSQAGSLDPAFDSDGKLIIPFSSPITGINSIAIQADGKIVGGGFNQSSGRNVFTLVRVNPDGTMDNSFDFDGKVTTTIDAIADAIFSIAIQPDGKIIAGGYSIGLNGFRFALVRYNPNGSLDMGFDFDGIVTTEVGTSGSIMYSLALQPDGKIVAAGFSDDGADHNFAIARYNPNGSLDNLFDFDGIVTTSIGPSNDTAYSVLVLPDGKIIVAGSSVNGTYTDFALARYESNGSLDTDFDFDGIVTTAIGPTEDVAFSIALQADGKYVTAGSSFNGTNHDFALVRYNDNGSLDNGFDFDGKLTTAVGTASDQAHMVALQSDGKIVVAGASQDAALEMDFALVRYSSAGVLDNSFDFDGKVTTDMTGNEDLGVALRLDGSRIYVGGISFAGEGMLLAAYLNDAFALPLQLTKFTGSQKNNKVHLQWQTSSEYNASHFIIQRSADGRTFSDIGSLQAAGNSNRLRNYDFTDEYPLEGPGYYRLRQVDRDAKFIYSPVIKIMNGVSELILRLSPNPASNFINITYTGRNEMVTVRIYNTQGKLVKQQTQRNQLLISVEVKHLVPGLYFITMTDRDSVQKGKFIKQ